MRAPAPLLSPRYDGGPRPSFQRNTSSSNTQRRHFGSNLALPGLPRFHPANYTSSQHSSLANTPGTGPVNPHGPLSPGLQQKMYAEAQRQVYAYQRETFSRSTSFSHHPAERPQSPRLEPLGSPGPVTPLELEYGDSYMHAKSPSRLSAASTSQMERSADLAQHMAQTQSQRQGAANNRPSSRQPSITLTRAR